MPGILIIAPNSGAPGITPELTLLFFSLIPLNTTFLSLYTLRTPNERYEILDFAVMVKHRCQRR